MPHIGAVGLLAKADPTAALRTMRMFAALCSADRYGKIRDDLILAGVPEHFLPSHEQARDRSDVDVAMQ